MKSSKTDPPIAESAYMEEAVTSCKEIGFTEYEAKVFLSLLHDHPAGAYAISRHSGVPHSRVYDTAQRLIAKGFVRRTESQPERFSPLAPDDVVEKLKRQTDAKVDRFRRALSKIPFTSDFDPVWNIHSRREALDILAGLASAAENRIVLGIWDEELFELADVLEEACRRGVEILFLLYGKAKPGFGQVYHHKTQLLYPVLAMGRTLDCVVDSNACLSGSLGGHAECQVVWTRNPGLVRSIEEYIIHDLYITEIETVFGQELTATFGKNLSALRRKFHPNSPG